MYTLRSESVSPTGAILRTYMPDDPLHASPLHLHWNGRGSRVALVMGDPRSPDSTRTSIDVEPCDVPAMSPREARAHMDAFSASVGRS